MRQLNYRAFSKTYGMREVMGWLGTTLYVDTGGRGHDAMNMENWELMQGTGLHDSKGKEIYEGDITTNGVIAYHTDLNWDGGGSIHPGFYFSSGELDYHVGFDENIEIIGNVYENPDLLNPKGV